MRMASPQRMVRCLALLAALSGAFGCAGPTGKVAGNVTLNQKPVADAELFFESVADPREQFFGSSDESGKYWVSYRTKPGMPIGAYRVIVTVHTVAKGAPLPAGEKGAILKREGAGHKSCYSFDANLAAGPNNLSFELTAGKSIPCP